MSYVNKVKIVLILSSQIHHSLPSENRVISLAHIAEKTKLSLDGVEFLLMKTLSVRAIQSRKRLDNVGH